MRLTPEVTTRVCEAISLGLTHELAAKYAGIGRSTFYLWIEKGRAQEDGPYRAFVEALDEAEAKNAARCMAEVLKAAKAGTWQAAAWLMERRHGYVVRQEQRIEHAGSVAIRPLQEIPDDDLDRMIEERRARMIEVSDDGA